MRKDLREGLLQWSPGQGRPRTQVFVESLKHNDLALPGPGLGAFWPYGSLIDAMAGPDPNLRRQFQADFHRFLADGHPARVHPAAPPCPDPNLWVYTYRVPAEWAQEYFLSWYRCHRGCDDFLEAAARKHNDYRHDQACPLVPSDALADPAFLKSTNGQAIGFCPDGLRLACDNRYNPYRWVGPINDIQHHEQPAICALSYGQPDVWDRVAESLEAHLAGKGGPRLLLDYDVALSISDYRQEMGEHTVWDFYGCDSLDEPMGVVSQTHYNAQKYIAGADSHGHCFNPGQARFVQQWVDRRYVAPNIQLSLMVNFLERHDRYRLAEFMLASYNQASIFFYDESLAATAGTQTDGEFNPFLVDGCGVIPTANQAMNPHVVDGGCSGAFAWTRTPVDTFARPEFWDYGPEARPIIREGGHYVDWTQGWPDQAHLFGTIDLTAYYLAGRRLGYFPGQRGLWGNHWVGFEGDLPQFKNSHERHGLEWAGIIFENHGPFRVQLDVAALNVRLDHD